jgi:replicative DNA helicase Mcm
MIYIITTHSPPNNPLGDFEEFLKYFEDGELNFKYKDRIAQICADGTEPPLLVVDLNDLAIHNYQLYNYLHTQPDHAMEELAGAFENYYLLCAGGKVNPDLSFLIELYDSTNDLEVKPGKIRAKHLNKLITIKGLVIRTRPPQPKIDLASFECPLCGNIMSLPQNPSPFAELMEPKDCTNPNCGNKRNFEYKSEDSEHRDLQFISIREEDQANKVPRDIRVVIFDHLVDQVQHGMHVKVTGIVKEYLHDESRGKKIICVTDKYLEANSITFEQNAIEDIEITQEDNKIITNWAALPEIHKIIARSIGTFIHGHDHVKLAMACALFGGVQIRTPEGTSRGDIHILIMGDPSLGKSQLMQEIPKLMPRAIITNGKGSSAAGLTMGFVMEKDNTRSLEAGALVLASGSVCGIDEFNTMRVEDRVALNEAMEQQFCSLSKAGFTGRVPCKTTIIAMANPKMGRYDPYKTPSENINLDPPLLSRFDIIILLRDIPDRAADEQIALAILNRHFKPEEEKTDVEGEQVKEQDSPPEAEAPPNTPPIPDRIPLDLLKKYIYLARHNYFPELTQAARERLKTFYVNLRDAGKDKDVISISARQMDGLVRLSQAFARMRLAEKVSVGDADLAIGLMSLTLKQLGYDEELGILNSDLVFGPGFGPDLPAKSNTPNTRHRDLIKQAFRTIWEADPTAPITAEDLLPTLATEGIGIELIQAELKSWSTQGGIAQAQAHDGYILAARKRPNPNKDHPLSTI